MDLPRRSARLGWRALFLLMDETNLLRQARWLRFDDPAQEERFRRFDDERSLRQWRIVTAAGALAVAGLWLVPSNAMVDTEAVARFGLVLPPAVVAFAFSWWRAQRHRLQFVGVVCATISVSMHLANQAATSVVRMPSPTTVASLMAVGALYLVAVAATLPLRTQAMAATLFITVTSFYLTLTGIIPELKSHPVLHAVMVHQWVSAFVVAGVMIGATWARERLQRISFAQREQLEAANAELARMNAEKNEFMAIAAHDLRGPLAAVGGAARQLQERPPAAGAGREAALIEAHAGRMLALVNDYLGAHTAESGTLPVRMATVDLAVVAVEAAGRQAATAAAKRQTIAVDELPGPVRVRADAALLAQVADNFLSNALKFSPPGATVRIEVHTAEGHPRVRFAVVDAGPGVSAAEQAQLFRKFGRGRAQPTGGEASHGLGLAVAKRLAETMDGTVGCENAEGGGAMFWVELARVEEGESGA